MSRAVAALTQRPLEARDRAPVEAMTRASALFRPEEVSVALDVFDAATGNGRRRDPDYQTMGAVAEGVLVGWICWGPTPCTVGTSDLYWIVVDTAWQGRGVGSALVAEMERQLSGKARLIVVETAGRDDYAPTRAFYAARGYHVGARIADYYADGDDLVTFVKRVSGDQGISESGDNKPGSPDSPIPGFPEENT